MMSNSRRIGARLVLLLAVLAVAASAAPINIGTNNGLWTITASGGAVNASAATTTSGGVSISSNGMNTGTAISGENLATFDGWWEAVSTFTIPVNYTGTLTFSGLGFDDRGVLELFSNTGFASTIIGNETISGVVGSGVMSLTDATATTFNGTTGFTQITSGNISNLAAGLYTLTLIVNNNGTGINTDRTQGFVSSADGTVAIFTGSVALTSTVPEPASLSYLLFGLVPLAIGFARRRRSSR